MKEDEKEKIKGLKAKNFKNSAKGYQPLKF